MKAIERFDDIVRSERYYTATLLPFILLHNYETGIQGFLDLVSRKASTERNASGDRVPKTSWPELTGADFELISEFHIARDLQAAHLLRTPTSAIKSKESKEKRDAPDLVIILGDKFIVCEAKFFTGFTVDDLNRQLLSQRQQIRHLFEVRPQLKAYQHIAILPPKWEDKKDLDCDGTITWTDIGTLAKYVLGEDHYVVHRLCAALTYYNQLVNSADLNFDGQGNLDEVERRCQEHAEQTHIGFIGGLDALRKQPYERLVQKRWKWRDPEANVGVANARNWVAGSDFLQIVKVIRLAGKT